jgi:hypothetical protein
MKRTLLALCMIAAIGVVVVAAGCGSPKTTLGPDLPPETTVYIQGTVDRVNHRVHLYWFGSDPDGYVVAYLMRFVPANGNADPKWDTLYCGLPGRCTDSVFTVQTGDSALIHTAFEIRSMDDKGVLDPTPATQPLTLTNLAPRVRITNPLRLADTSFASVTISWEVDDIDGGGPGLHYRIWLDGNRAGYDSTAANLFTVPSARFLQGGAYRTGFRTLYLQAVDDGGLSGPLDSTRWFVRAPAKRDPIYHRSLLVIDNSRSASQNNQSVDTTYVQTLRRNNLPDTCFVVQRLEFSNPFRSAEDLRQTLALFDAVAWYRGYDFHSPSDFTSSTTLKNYQDVVGDYILNGGRILLEGLYLIEGRDSFGALHEDFVSRYLNCPVMLHQFNALFADSTVGISTAQSGLRLRSSLYGDVTVQMTAVPAPLGVSPGLRAFVANDTSQVAFWAIQGQLTGLDPAASGDPLGVPMAISIDRPPAGRLILLSMPSRALVAPANMPFNKRPLAQLLFGKDLPPGRNGLLSP